MDREELCLITVIFLEFLSETRTWRHMRICLFLTPIWKILRYISRSLPFFKGTKNRLITSTQYLRRNLFHKTRDVRNQLIRNLA